MIYWNRYNHFWEQVQCYALPTAPHNKYNNLVVYRVRSLTDLAIIITFFKSFPLMTSKRHNFNLFVIIYEMLCKKEHLSLSGFLISIAIINNINSPIKPNLLAAAPILWSLGPLPSLVLPPVILLNKYMTIPGPWWIIGFICGETSFNYGAAKYFTSKFGDLIKYKLLGPFWISSKYKRYIHITNDFYLFGSRYNFFWS